MPLILPGNVGSATAATTYSIANSCRWNYADSPAMNKSQTAGNKKTWTYSWWCKRGEIGGSAEKDWFKVYASGSKLLHIRFNTNDTLYIEGETPNSIRLTTNRVFRDPSAWYHFALIMDTTQGTDTNRMKLFVNGTQETSFASVTYPTENGDTAMNDSGATFYLGTTQSATEEFDGYMAEVVLLDGTAAAIGDLGEFDEDSPTIWKPKDPSGLSFGNNGFWLDFEDSSNLGNDQNGGTDFTESNLAAVDQCLDTPTNNFCTLNPLDNYWQNATFSEGNNRVVTQPGTGLTGSYYTYNTGTFGLTAGKWYFEARLEVTAGTYDQIGIAGRLPGAQSHDLGKFVDTYSYQGATGKSRTNATLSTYGDSYGSNGNIVGVYIDLDNNKLYFGKNGTVQNSGTGISVTDPASVLTGVYFPAAGDQYNNASSGSSTWAMNFGATAFGGTAISSGNADANGYGNFEYDPSSGTFDGASKDFLAICTKNLGSDGG